ncbi:glycosyltransferase family 4 protein [uncultured Desulfovibrio sp.]|uniref:glycosyltransferase family 4 protein n=1 Tax=uncultured Desulfovibrio sp. TaxID=167968 RepID=UPI00271212BA|nr:glycosyltransferase family 4 protein [uncultured Desulfovibrio sp.]
MRNKIKIYLNYPHDKFSKNLISLPIVQCMYDYFSNQDDIEVVDSLDNIDVFFFFAGGPSGKSKKHNKIINFLTKYGNIFPSLLAKRYFLKNITAEDILHRAIQKNKNMKIIHRLDDRYLLLCKLYGNEKTIINVQKKADITVYQSKYCQSLYENNVTGIFGPLKKLQPQKSCFIYNGTDTSIFTPLGDRFNLQGKIRICHAAATGMPRKGLALVLAMAHLLKNNSDIHFYLLGRQDTDPISGYKISQFKNITHIPFIKDREEMAKYLRSMTIFLFPSVDDCSPNVVLEAMASGLPILAEESGGVPELIVKEDGLRAGLFIDHENPIFNLKLLLENRKEFSENAISIINKYHTSKLMCENYKKLIYSLVNDA